MASAKHKRSSMLDNLSIFVILFALVLTYRPAIVTAGSQQPSPLQVTLRSLQSSSGINGKLDFELCITNRSRRTIYIPKDLDIGEDAAVSLWASSMSTGKAVHWNRIPDALPPPPSSKEAFVGILARSAFKARISVYPGDLAFDTPGVYLFQAVYHSPIPKNHNFGLPIWSRDSGLLYSNSVSIVLH